ncbi:GntR family transcriptional regulator [Cupriavidus sp. a3]|uniref:GntR family transcriptional regulator n=1 Tax=Cupriavidus sp. a3 TaxID=3242158 RepID=UPI003D9C1115
MTRGTAHSSANDSLVLGEDGSDGVTRYRQLASVIRHKIVSGEYPVGQQLPTVDAMAQTYGIAKVTVRQAFALLAEEGLISSQRGRGTHVMQVPSGLDERLRAAINDDSVAATDLEIRILDKREDVSLPPELSRHGKPLDSYVMVRKLHVHDGAPFCLIEMFVATSVYAKFPRGGEKRHKLVHLLRRAAGERLGIMRQTLTVEPADYVLVRDLGYIFGAPVAKMARTILDIDGNVLMAGTFWYRGDRFVLDVALPATLTEHYPALTIPETRR